MRVFLLLLTFPMILFARGGDISHTHRPYLRYLHDASYLTELHQDIEADHLSLAFIKPTKGSGQVKFMGGLVNDPNTGQMVDSGRPRTYEANYSGEIIIIDELSDRLPSDLQKISYRWTLNPEEYEATTREAIKDRAYNVWSEGGYVLMAHTSELNKRGDVISHSVIPSDWVDLLRPGLEAQQELESSDQQKLKDAAASGNPVIAQYALRKLAELGELDLATFTQSISNRNNFDEVALVSAVISSIDEYSSGSDELKSAILKLAKEQSSYEKAVLYSMSKYINFPSRSPRLRMYAPSSDLLAEFSSTAEKTVTDHFSGKAFSDFMRSMDVHLFGSQRLKSKPESTSISEPVQAPVAVKVKSEEPTEEPAEVVVAESVEECKRGHFVNL